eukprot:1623195-Amphidinium_carterae.4
MSCDTCPAPLLSVSPAKGLASLDLLGQKGVKAVESGEAQKHNKGSESQTREAAEETQAKENAPAAARREKAQAPAQRARAKSRRADGFCDELVTRPKATRAVTLDSNRVARNPTFDSSAHVSDVEAATEEETSNGELY